MRDDRQRTLSRSRLSSCSYWKRQENTIHQERKRENETEINFVFSSVFFLVDKSIFHRDPQEEERRRRTKTTDQHERETNSSSSCSSFFKSLPHGSLLSAVGIHNVRRQFISFHGRVWDMKMGARSSGYRQRVDERFARGRSLGRVLRRAARLCAAVGRPPGLWPGRPFGPVTVPVTAAGAKG